MPRGLHRVATSPPFGCEVSGGCGLDGALPTSAVSLTALPRKNRPRWGHFAAAFSTACEAEYRPLTLPFAFRVGPGLPGSHQNTRTAARPFRVNERGLFGPERLLSPSAWRSALRFLPDPPLCPRFRHRGASFRSVFTTQRSRVEWLGSEPGAFTTMTFRAARRLSRSAIVTIREHDHETAQTRSPCAQSPTLTALPDGDLAISASRRWPRALSKRSQPRFHRLGAAEDPPTASLVTIARDQSFAPTRSARAPLVARPSRPGLGYPGCSKRHLKRSRFALSPMRQACACPTIRAASRCSPRRESRYAAPEVPSIDSRLPEGG